MAKDTLWRKNLGRSASTKNTKRMYKSKCYAVTKLTSSRILSLLLSRNNYTSKSDIAGAVTPQMLSKRIPHDSRQDFLLKSRG